MKQKILETFLYNQKLRFNEIEKLTKIRSNKLAYYLKKLEEKKILIKNRNFYMLSESSEELIPYISERDSVLTVLLIAIKKSKKIFLIKRQKRPFKDKLALPGGRLLKEESIKQGVKRIMKEKFNINAELEKINSVSLEHVKKENKTIHSFMLLFVTAKAGNNLEYAEIEKNRKKIIPSDYRLIKNDLEKEIKIKTFLTPN